MGDVLEGRGLLLQQGQPIATVDYHLTIPEDSHLMTTLARLFHFNHQKEISGFILLPLKEAETITLTDYTLQLANDGMKTIRIERRYKKINHRGEERISFWVKAIK